MPLTLRALPYVCGRWFPVTLLVDLALLAALVGAPWLRWAWPGALAAAVAIGFATTRVSLAAGAASVAPPWSWLVWCVLMPVSTLAGLRRGLWAGAHPQARLRCRVGATALLVFLTLASVTRQADGYGDAAGLARLDAAAATYLDGAVERSSVMLLTVAALGAAVSVLKSFDVSLGVGLTLGEALDPVDRLIEGLAWVMAASSASLIAQRLLLEIGGAVALPLLLSAGLALLTLGLWLPRAGLTATLARLGRRLLFAALLVRLLVPVIAVASDDLGRRFIDPSLDQARGSIEGVAEELSAGSADLGAVAQTIPQTAAGGLWATVKEAPANLTGLLTRLNVTGQLEAAKRKLSALAAQLVRMIALLLLQTILLPLAVAWALWRITLLLAAEPARPAPAAGAPEG